MLLFAAFLLPGAATVPAFADAPPAAVPPAVYTDPPADAAHPAHSKVLHVPDHGVKINGLMYAPSGAGPHPTLLICHGLPGNEKNLDLAQAVRRAGWNAVTFNYRGSWGSPGKFLFEQNGEDAAAVLRYLRDPSNAAALGIDPQRIAIAGHSMGGWVTAQTAAHDPALLGAILISMGDMSRIADLPTPKAEALMADNMEALAGVTAAGMVADVKAHARQFQLVADAAGLAHLPLLALTADDGLAPDTDALVEAIRAHGGTQVTLLHVATDHGWSDHRIALEGIVIDWLAKLQR
jgi:pimeloyl-ACP methyl ester carboxylesterase